MEEREEITSGGVLRCLIRLITLYCADNGDGNHFDNTTKDGAKYALACIDETLPAKNSTLKMSTFSNNVITELEANALKNVMKLEEHEDLEISSRAKSILSKLAIKG